jgi:hypothetical protein
MELAEKFPELEKVVLANLKSPSVVYSFQSGNTTVLDYCAPIKEPIFPRLKHVCLGMKFAKEFLVSDELNPLISSSFTGFIDELFKAAPLLESLDLRHKKQYSNNTWNVPSLTALSATGKATAPQNGTISFSRQPTW